MKTHISWIVIVFVLVGCQKSQHLQGIDSSDEFIIWHDSTALLTYRKSTFFPAGIDSVYAKSAFIHPLHTLSGKMLTQINPEGHPHHYGLWNPWTHVLFQGDTIDFWNLDKRQGFVEFSKFENYQNTHQLVSFQVWENHVVALKEQNVIAIKELKTVSLQLLDASSYVVDFKIELTPETDTVTLLQWRYGGFCWRAPADWTDRNTIVSTSEGQDRLTADGAQVKWVCVQNVNEDQKCGLIMMSNSDNQNHPEPLRLWPPTESNKGQMMVNFSPTKFSDWQLIPGQKYTLQYRLVIFDGELKNEEIQALYNNYLK